MEYLEGKPLQEMKYNVPLKQAIDIGIQLAEGLAAAHQKGIVHRDHVWWAYNTAVPMESAKRFDDVWAANNKVVEYALKPLTILAYDSFAVVNYVWTGYEMATGEKPKYATYRATEVYKKEGTKWLLVANHGGGFSELK